jgi:hypothetical protein
MGNKISRYVAATFIATLVLTGCAPAADTPPAPSAAASDAAPEAPAAADIVTMDDAIAWARGVDDTVSADELSAGIQALGDLVPEEDIWFATNNEIGMALIELNADVQSDPAAAGDKVDDLQSIVDDLETAIEKGPNP